MVSTDTFNLSIAGSFANNNTESEIDVNTFNLSAAGDFDYANTGTINTANSFNLNVAGNFNSNDGGNNFIWDANDRLTVEGTADIVADNYIQYGVINVAGAWTIDANGSFTYSNATSISINGPSSSNIYNAILNVTICNNISSSFNCKSIICTPNEIITTVVAVEITSYIEVEAISSINSSCISIIKITSCRKIESIYINF